MSRPLTLFYVLLFVAIVLAACASVPRGSTAHAVGTPVREAPPGVTSRLAVVKTTGYCKCGDCCGWHRSWFGLGPPVISSGPLKGRPKSVGITASRTEARPGVIAADTNLFPFGTVMHIPGYGWGRVEDIGGAIKGYHLDLYFTSHDEAREWGVRKRKIEFWRPPGAKPRNQRFIQAPPQSVSR